MSAQAGIAIVVGCAAIVDDLVRRRISNWIPLVALVSGLVLHTLENGWRGGLLAGAGAIAGGAVFLLFYLWGGLGGGDIKLMTGFGAILGSARVLEAALWTAACGGVIACGVIVTRAVRGFCNKRRHLGTRQTQRPAQVPSIPYAPAIAIGAWMSLISNPSTRGLG